MPNLNIQVTDFLPEFSKLTGKLDFAKTLPNTLAALNIIAHKYLIQWRKYTMGEPVPGAPKAIWSRGPYTRSIEVDTNADEVKYIQSQGPWTNWIESGHGEIDLKPGLLSGARHRVGANGPYNIVHFRHGVPGTLPSNNPMPLNIHQLIKRETDKADRAFKQGRATKPGTSTVTGNVNVAGKQVRTYQWGYKIPVSAGGMPMTKDTSKGKYTWKAGKHAGMVRMDTSTARARSTQYMTFRTVSIKSDPASWIVPPQDPIPIRQAVVEAMKDEIPIIIKAALEEDLK